MKYLCGNCWEASEDDNPVCVCGKADPAKQTFTGLDLATGPDRTVIRHKDGTIEERKNPIAEDPPGE